MSPSNRASKVWRRFGRAHLCAQMAGVASVLLIASAASSASPQSEPPKPAQKPAVTREALFPNNRGAQRMTNVAGEELSLASGVASHMPDWAEWWSTHEVMVGLGIPEDRVAAVEALLEVRKQARIAAITASENSEAGRKYAEAARGVRVDSKPPLEVRAELGRLASRAVSQALDAIREADRAFAESCARLVVSETQPEPEPDEAILRRMHLGVQRLRGFDPALSRMKLLNTGVELTIHAAPLLEKAGESRQAIADAIAAWQQAALPLLEAFERQQAEIVAATASDQPLEQRVRRGRAAEDLQRTIRADLVATTVRFARGIAAVVVASDPDRANAWLRSVYHALSPANLRATSGDAALDEAARIAAASGKEGEEWSAALAAIRVENLRACVELEGVLIDACIQAIRDRDKMIEVRGESGPVFVVNERRFAQSAGVLSRVVGAVPSQHRSAVERASRAAQSQTFHHFPSP
jgi:hypothetical protein